MSFEQDRPGYGTNPPHSFDNSNSSNNDYRGSSSGNGALNDETSRRLEAALHSPYGIDKLLNRLKQSIYSARELSSFLRERCALEDRHAQGYKKLVRHTIEAVRRTEARQGSYARHLDESLKVNETIADNGLAFASALHTMAEELRDVAENAEKGRKHWKHSTIDAEKRLADAESAQQKAKDKYNNAADQYDKVRTGERQGGKFGLKKQSAAQQEEALKEKADALDQEYATKFEAAQAQKREFEGTARPQIVRSLQELIDECDAAVAMQMAKLASVSEKHVVSNGMAIAPIRTGTSDTEPRGLRQIAGDIDDRKDFSEYMLDGVEAPPQFKGRSRRNTDAEIIHTPTQRTDTMETPHSASQQNFESRPPQLPHIGGASDSFSRSFEAERPSAQTNRSSYIGGQSDALSSNPTHQSQQTGITKDPAPSLPTGRGAPPVPSLPSYDRGQAPAGDALNNNNNGFNRSQGQFRQNAALPATDQSRTSMDNTTFNRDREQGPSGYGSASTGAGRGPPFAGDSLTDRTSGSGRQDNLPSSSGRGQGFGNDSFVDRTQGPGGQDTMPSFAGRGQPTALDSFGDRTQGPTRQENLSTFGGRGQSSATDAPSDRFQAPGRQDTMPPFSGRGQPTATGSLTDRNQGLTGQDATLPPGGRGQSIVGAGTAFTNYGQNTDRGYQQGPATGTFPDSSKMQGPVDNSGFGRGQNSQGLPLAGKGGALAGRSMLPSQQQQQQQQQVQQPPRPALPPTRPVFGMHLDDLFRRDGSAVPIIVFQCIQAVDTFGLSTQGIYRVSGSSPTVQQLKSEFDHDSGTVDLTNREAFNHDIAAVATLLKNFLRDLPDPLLTATAYHSFLQAARYEDNIQRRDALHQYINSLPDPNYATLRVLVLHLHRISMNSEVNMMDIKNLAIVFGPTVMGGNSMSDTGLQTKVLETILHHTHDIFDPDE